MIVIWCVVFVFRYWSFFWMVLFSYGVFICLILEIGEFCLVLMGDYVFRLWLMDLVDYKDGGIRCCCGMVFILRFL